MQDCCERWREYAHALWCAGLEAKYGRLQPTGSEHELQESFDIHVHSDGALSKKASNKQSTGAKDRPGNECCSEAPSTSDARETSDLPAEDALPSTEERKQRKTQTPATQHIEVKEGTSLDAGKPGSTSTGADSDTLDSACDEPQSHELDNPDWASCMEACKGRLNRMLLDCGMPDLSNQV